MATTVLSSNSIRSTPRQQLRFTLTVFGDMAEDGIVGTGKYSK
ncbi:hypothetical protein [Mycobacterium sp.]